MFWEFLIKHWSSIVIGGLVGIVWGQREFIKAQKSWINYLNQHLFEMWSKDK